MRDDVRVGETHMYQFTYRSKPIPVEVVAILPRGVKIRNPRTGKTQLLAHGKLNPLPRSDPRPGPQRGLFDEGTADGECPGNGRGGRGEPCCDRSGQYNGYGSDGPLRFACPKGCSCHD